MLVQTTIIGALGPTNTGKTFRAIERMKEFPTGMLGFPLRLLAREVYDQLVKSLGVEFVALVTGEEKKIPLRPRYWICTVEAMPLEREVDFLAVDEVQLAAHRQRGHIFTDRILNARGRLETWFIGSPSIRFILQSLVPTIRMQTYERLSTLTSDGVYTLGQLPKRTAVVAFTAARVYELAEHISNRRGGVAIVMGALSPRARNAQVQLFQKGDVDYLVSTDAIGMGLNLDLSRVAFADIRKYDGVRKRDLDLAELSQIAGRAGRYRHNGSFGTLDRCRPLDFEVIRNIEGHRTEALRSVFYRNSSLDFTSLGSLMSSLLIKPGVYILKGAPFDTDVQVLEYLAQQREVQSTFRGLEKVELLWTACQIPNFRQLLLERQAEIALEIALEVLSKGALSDAFMTRKTQHLAEHAGGIDAIMARISQVRLWSYVSFRESWVLNARRFQKVCADIEDRLSDDLHTTLVERFVPRRSKSRTKGIDVQGAFSGLASLHAQLLDRAEALNALPSLLDAPDTEITFEKSGVCKCRGERLANVIVGKQLLDVRFRVTPEFQRLFPNAPDQLKMEQKTQRALTRLLLPLANKLSALEWSNDSSVERGLAYQLKAGLGLIPIDKAQLLIDELSAQRKVALAKKGLLIGEHCVMISGVLRGETGSVRRKILDWSRDHYPEPLNQGVPAFRLEKSVSLNAQVRADLFQGGYITLSGYCLRLDLLERIIRRLNSAEPGDYTPAQAALMLSQDFGIKLAAARKVASKIMLGQSDKQLLSQGL